MPEVRAELTSERDPDELAKRVMNFYGIHAWAPGVNDTVPDPDRPGTRLCTLATGSRVAEQLVDMGPAFVRYRMITDETSPMSDYEAELRVTPGPTGGSVLTWEASFRCAAALEEPLARGVRSSFEEGLEGLRTS